MILHFKNIIMEREIVTITGVSGYLGSQVCKQFLEHGQYKVRGTVRSTTNPKKIEPLKKAFGDLFDQLELVEADLSDKESLMKACEGASYIIHTASPVTMEKPKHENDVIKPAVDGTLSVMEAAKANKAKHVVITSSLASVWATKDKKRFEFSSEDWSDLTACTTYQKSKTMAEKAAWDFQAQLSEEEKFNITVILPGFIIGPTLVSSQNLSGEAVKKMMLRSYSATPFVKMPSVDVRDCARAHLQAIVIPEAANKRFILVSECCWFNELGQHLHDKFYPDYNPPCKNMSRWMGSLASWFSSDLASLLPKWGKPFVLDTAPSKQTLGIEYISVKDSIQEMGTSLIEVGYIEDRRKNK